jgi:hypothetical protein
MDEPIPEVASPVGPEAAAGVKLLVSLEKTSFSLGETIPLAVTLRNDGAGDVWIVQRSQWLTPRVLVTDESGKPVPWSKEGKARREAAEAGYRSIRHLAPGETVRDVIEIDKAFRPTGPGNYRVAAERYVSPSQDLSRAKTVKSNELLVRILPGAGPAVEAKFIDRSPDLLSDAYWDAHDVALVRTVYDKGAIRFEIQSVLWGSPAPDSVRADRVQIVRFLRGEPGNWILAGDQSYVAYIPRQEPAVVALESIDENASSRLSTLRTIADLHARPEGTRLAAAAFSADPLVARYALGRLVREPVRAAGFELGEIRRLRDDDGRIPEVRALAARLLAVREGGGVAFDREYDWIVAALLTAHPSDYREVGPLVDRLIDFDLHRIETARLSPDWRPRPTPPTPCESLPTGRSKIGACFDPRTPTRAPRQSSTRASTCWEIPLL